MMKPTHLILSSFQSAAKLALYLCIGLQVQAADIFSSSAKDKTAGTPSLGTVAELMDAARSGDIPASLTSEDPPTANRYRQAVGNSVVAILQKKNLLPKDLMRHDTASSIGLLFVNISVYELSGQKDESAPESFQSNWKQFCSEIRADANPKLRDELDSILKEYSQAVKESLILKKERDDRRVAEGTEKQRQSDLAVQKMSDAAAQRKAVVGSQAASKRAEDEARSSAVKGAMQGQAEERKKKLATILASPAYKLWQASVEVEEGVRMIATGRSELAKEAGVERESGVADLTARRAAGEHVAAGKRLVEKAYDNYRQLGGDAATPEDVKAGPDPAADYR